jgi:hypothetical protein
MVTDFELKITRAEEEEEGRTQHTFTQSQRQQQTQHPQPLFLFCFCFRGAETVDETQPIVTVTHLNGTSACMLDFSYITADSRRPTV